MVATLFKREWNTSIIQGKGSDLTFQIRKNVISLILLTLSKHKSKGSHYGCVEVMFVVLRSHTWPVQILGQFFEGKKFHRPICYNNIVVSIYLLRKYLSEYGFTDSRNNSVP